MLRGAKSPKIDKLNAFNLAAKILQIVLSVGIPGASQKFD
jgi:hypothetical protein